MKQARLKGQVALVTGAGRGIGRATAQLFAAQGAKVLIATRTRESAMKTAADIEAAGGIACAHTVNIDSRTAAAESVERTIEKFGALDIVVHNAASTPFARISSTSDTQLEEAFRTNLSSAFWLASAAEAHLAKSGSGCFLAVSSITGNRQFQSGYAAYGSSKAGLNAFVRMAAAELGAKRIRVNGVEPGLTLTEAVVEKFPAAEAEKIISRIPLGRAAAPSDIANALLFLASREAQHITGQMLVIDGGQSLAN